MAHYTGPKARINRRLGVNIFESAGALKATERRPNPPGMHPRPRKPSTYGLAMREKQKVKYYYGLGERALRGLFHKARRTRGNTGDALLILCERRLDNVVREAGFAKTRPQARQGVAHGHFLHNGRKLDIPSALVRVGDVIQVKPRKNLVELYRHCMAESAGETPSWLAVDVEHLRAEVIALPRAEDVTLPVDIGMVVELLAR